MTLFNFFSITIILLYALGSMGTFWGIPSSRQKIQLWGKLFTWAGFVLHTILIIGIVLLHRVDELSTGYFMQLLAWSILLAYFIGWRLLKSSFLSMTAAPIALLVFILGRKLDHAAGRIPSGMVEFFFILHIVPLFISLGLLALAFGAALLFLHMERKIKTKSKLSDFDLSLPALESFDRINHKAVLYGFPLYTLGIAAGFIGGYVTWGGTDANKAGGWDPKEIITLFVWFLYAMLFHLRLIQGWRGRKAATLAICIFAISVFSLIGVNWFMNTHHSFNVP